MPIYKLITLFIDVEVFVRQETIHYNLYCNCFWIQKPVYTHARMHTQTHTFELVFLRMHTVTSTRAKTYSHKHTNAGNHNLNDLK